MLNKLLNLYKSSQQNTPLEDFTTEVFVGLLNMNEEIKEDFIYNFLKLPVDKYHIKTQVRFFLEQDNHCIVDIVIEGSDNVCFIENKVNSGEGYRQLERYAKVLSMKREQNKVETFLFYCTKYYDRKHYNFHDLKCYRWFEVASFLKKYNQNSFVNQFINFLKNQDMAQELTFNAKDFLSLSNLQNIMNKMNEYLDRAKPSFIANFPVSNQKLSNGCDMQQIKNHNRMIFYFKEILPASKGWTEIKYGFLLNKPEIYAGIWVDSSHNDYKKFIECINRYQEDFKVETLPKGAYIELKKDISIFLNNESAELEIQKWFEETFNKFRRFINETSTELKWNIDNNSISTTSN